MCNIWMLIWVLKVRLKFSTMSQHLNLRHFSNLKIKIILRPVKCCG